MKPAWTGAVGDGNDAHIIGGGSATSGDTGKLVRRRNAANTGWEIVENYGAGTDPTTGDDAADGYVRGAMWLNVSAGRRQRLVKEEPVCGG